jgi:hypothetical protein
MNTIQVAMQAVQAALQSDDVPPYDTQDRALWRIRFLLAAFYDGDTAGEDTETPVNDLLTDLVHYAQAEDLNLEQCLERGEWMAAEELKDWGLTPSVEEPVVLLPAPRDGAWQPGEQAVFTYSLHNDPQSAIARELYPRSGSLVTVLRRVEDGPDDDPDLATLAQSADAGALRVYGVRFPDGHEGDAFEDELSDFDRSGVHPRVSAGIEGIKQ